ncbi:MAG: electron transport complex subunit RsxA [Gammaproteobacteria bacterium]|nr:electron transport complex subunit RsxA [Gammaproteobacteria bacterium]
MKNLFIIFLNSIFINNFVLAKFLGLCPIFGVSKQVKSALGLSLATVIILVLSCTISYLIYYSILVPLHLQWLEIIIFIFVIACLVQACEIIIKAKSPLLQRNLGIYLPLITTNCSVLGLALLNIRENNNLIETIIYSIGSGCGFALVLIAFSAIREQLQVADIPKPFEGGSIAMITMGLIALGFMGFSGFNF